MVTGAKYANGGNAKAQLCISARGLDWDRDNEMKTIKVAGEVCGVEE
jgi:hypothetical protein